VNLVSFTKGMKTDKLRREEDEKELAKFIISNATGKHREEGRKGKEMPHSKIYESKPRLLTMIAASMYRPTKKYLPSNILYNMNSL
jgi:hypothetical protein